MVEKLNMEAPGNTTVKYKSRVDWGAVNATGVSEALRTPVTHVIYMNTATERCSDHLQCCKILQMLQNFHMKKQRKQDVRYSFIVGGDGTVYEGRGWYLAPLLPIAYQDMQNYSISIAFAGRYRESNIPDHMLRSGSDFIDAAVKKGLIVDDYTAKSIFRTTPVGATPPEEKALSLEQRVRMFL